MKLDTLGRHSCRVEANAKWNDSRLDVAVGERYAFEARGEWVDWFIRTNAAGFTSNLPGVPLIEPFRRAPDANWFALIGCVEHDLSTRLVLGVASNHTFECAGRLYTFANDVPGFYWNNRGVVELFITRLE